MNDSPYHLIVTPFFPVEDILKPVRYIVETGSADAIILNQIRPEDPRVAYLLERKFPFVTHGRSKWSDQHGYFDFDNVAYGEKAANDLHARGRKSIALLGPPLIHSYGRHIIEGAERAAQRNGQDFVRLEDVNSDAPREEMMRYVTTFLEDHPEIDAFITGSTNAATAAVGAVERTGRTLGGDIDVYTKEAEPYLTLVRPEVIACFEDVGAAGSFLARAALRAVRNPDERPMQYLDAPATQAFPD